MGEFGARWLKYLCINYRLIEIDEAIITLTILPSTLILKKILFAEPRQSSINLYDSLSFHDSCCCMSSKNLNMQKEFKYFSFLLFLPKNNIFLWLNTVVSSFFLISKFSTICDILIYLLYLIAEREWDNRIVWCLFIYFIFLWYAHIIIS